MATTFSTFGDAQTSVSSLTDGIGGSAAVDDWLTLTTSGIDGSGLAQPQPSDDVSGATGWEKISDFTSSEGGNSFRTTTWRKRCVGSEMSVTVTWPGASNVAFVGMWLSAPTQRDLYIIDEGLTVWDGTWDEFTCAPGSIRSDEEPYIGVIANGRTTLTAGDIETPPGSTAGLFEPLNGFVHVLGYYNDNEAAHTVADTLTFQVQPEAVIYALFLGLGPEFVDLAGTAGVISAAGSLAVGGTISLSGSASPVSGTGALEVEGGDAELGGIAAPLSGTGRLFAPSPFPQPVRMPEDHLGCGIYQAFAFTRGLGEIVTMLPFTDLDYARILDETSAATLTIDGVANPRALARCCRALSELEPSEHELAIYRNGWRVWSGPMTDLSFPAEQCIIQASDLSWWLAQRAIDANINSVQQDLVNILVAYVSNAMARENSAGLIVQVLALAGQLGDRLVEQADHQYASDVIAELARTGIDWTQIDRRMLVGPLQPQPPPYPGATPYPTLIDANFRIQPTILVSGSQGANCWYVNGPPNGAGDLIFGEYGPAFPATPDHVAQPAAPDYAAIEAQYGRIEKVVTESRILNQDSIDFNAQTRYDLLKRPLVYISDGALLPSTPIPMEKLLPGSIVNVHLSNVCRVIGEPYRIKAVKVRAASDGSEQVDVQWQPLGTGEVL